MAFTLRWLGQGGFLIQLGTHSLCVDPYLSDSVAYSNDGFRRLPPIPIAPQALHCDLLISTHDHLDHLDPDTIQKTNLPLYGGPESCLTHFRKLGIDEQRLRHIGRGDSFELGEAHLAGVYAEHTADSIGLVIEYQRTKIYITGDSEYSDRLLEAGKLGIDLLLVCVNGRLGNMTAAQAAYLAEHLPCRVAIPMHYGMFQENTVDPQEFTSALSIPHSILNFNQEYPVEQLLNP